MNLEELFQNGTFIAEIETAIAEKKNRKYINSEIVKKHLQKKPLNDDLEALIHKHYSKIWNPHLRIWQSTDETDFKKAQIKTPKGKKNMENPPPEDGTNIPTPCPPTKSYPTSNNDQLQIALDILNNLQAENKEIKTLLHQILNSSTLTPKIESGISYDEFIKIYTSKPLLVTANINEEIYKLMNEYICNTYTVNDESTKIELAFLNTLYNKNK